MAELSFHARMDPPADELVARFRFGERVVKEQQAARMRMLGGRLLAMLREEAPGKSGAFAEKIRLRVEELPDSDVRLEIGIPQPLGGWIVEGTRPHTIRPKGPGYPLRFFWQRGPQGPGKYHFYSVRHPGTKANPFTHRAYRRWLPEAQREIRALGQAYVRAVSAPGAGAPGAGQFW